MLQSIWFIGEKCTYNQRYGMRKGDGNKSGPILSSTFQSRQPFSGQTERKAESRTILHGQKFLQFFQGVNKGLP